MDNATQAMTEILDLVGMDDLQAELATARVEAPESIETTDIVLVTGTWTEDELTKLEGIATKLKQNPATVTAAETLLNRVHAARGAS